MAEPGLWVPDAPLAETEGELEEDEMEEQSEASSAVFSPDTPLAKPGDNCVKTEDGDEWNSFAVAEGVPDTGLTSSVFSGAESVFGSSSSGYSSLAGTCDNLSLHARNSASASAHYNGRNRLGVENGSGVVGFSEGGSHGGSLEDLVESFDEKISACFGDMASDVSDLAPVQIRTQDELISQSQLWHDLTASFGTVMPVDWSKTVIRNKLFLPVLNLRKNDAGAGDTNGRRKRGNNLAETEESLSEDDASLPQMDMHSIVAADWQDEPGSSGQSKNPNVSKLATAEEVIKEIDQMMQDENDDARAGSSERSQTNQDENGDSESVSSEALPALPSPLYEDRLAELTSVALNELQTELERLTQLYSEILVQQLALRDEQQFEKEVKNSFISELIKVQNKRRQMLLDRKKKSTSSPLSEKSSYSLGQGKYLTTIIPYEPSAPGGGAGGVGVSTRHMQIMIKILQAINDDSPTTPTLLTDYILKVLCPKD